MWALGLLMVLGFDTAAVRRVALAPAESLNVGLTGRGAPVVMIPGLFGSAFGFRRLVPRLAEAGVQAVVIEPLAFGASARPYRADYSLHAQARRVAAALDSLGVRDAVLVGHSLGGAIALRVAFRAVLDVTTVTAAASR